MPFIWGFLAVGIWVGLRRIPWRWLLAAVAGVIAVTAFFALPFALEPRLLAYAHGGTDQWGYASVSKWLTLHSVDELPVLGAKPGLDWVWQMLVIRDRPLIYVILAGLASSFGFQTIVAYYVLPAAMMSALFLAIFLSGTKFDSPPDFGRLAVSLGITLQPIVWLHFQHQYLAGTVAGLALAIFAVALCENLKGSPGYLLFLSMAALLGVLLAGIYTLAITGVTLAILGLVVGINLVRDWKRTKTFPLLASTAGTKWCSGGVCVLAVVCLAMMRQLTREPLQLPAGLGVHSHKWAQIGSVFGMTEVTSWYQRAEIPEAHVPDGSGLGIVLTLVTVFLFGFQAVRWWRQRGDVTLAVIFSTVVAAVAVATSSHGDSVILSRCLPIFGPLLLVVMGFVARSERNPWARWAMVALACLPVVRAAPGIWRMLRHPENTLVEDRWNAPPKGDPWGTAAYVYFYRDSRPIDWSMAPDAFHLQRDLGLPTASPAPSR